MQASSSISSAFPLELGWRTDLPDHHEICSVKICDAQLRQLSCLAGLVLSINQKMGHSRGGFYLPSEAALSQRGSIGQPNHSLQDFVRDARIKT
jgi:hypothetical protein